MSNVKTGSEFTQADIVMMAQNVAELVAERMATRIREEIRDDLAKLRLELKEDMRQEMLGTMHPSEHTSQHDRIEKFLKLIESIQQNFFGKVIANLLIIGTLAMVFGYTFFSGGVKH